MQTLEGETMKVYLSGEDAFVEISSGYLLYIGTKEEVKNATQKQIKEMVANAIKIKQIENGG